ncbi:porin [Ohtaekwangia koreensis]|uniref:Phosphate-selective porin O and P n=1 Tax=Ohtaekwangia koreensis TaxID=688867 RepID=A0A1T5L6Z0_9BACT|nr:porin [Ohtaekwangia koreensis]SKC71826.1 Phosphate-selective porin O and P [Ohtaekwangia koreensis]
MKKIYILLFILAPMCLQAQENYWIKTDSLFKYVQPVASLQFWSTYTMGEKDQLTDNGPMESVQDRLNFLIRRARIGFKGKPYKKLSYAVMIQYDNMGKDRFSAVRGSTNTGTLGILDAYATWRISKNEMASLTVGYFHPQISRECVTGDLLVNSFDKSPTQAYIRQHITGKGYGRATGINLGGLTSKHLVTIDYNVGIFSNNTTSEEFTETSGKYWSPLVVDRVTFTVGDTEKKNYAINYDANNYYSKRKGITVGLNSSVQGKTDIFTSNYAGGFDVLFNYGRWNIDGEWMYMERHTEAQTYNMKAGHIRAGYNLIIKDKIFLEPCVMVTNFEGDQGAQFSGEDRMLDVGVNWYLNKKNCKLSLHYITQQGHGDNNYTDDITFKKGDFAGLAFVLLM